MNMFRRLMYGRYGSDQLSFFLLAFYLVLVLLSNLPHMGFLAWVAAVIIVWDIYRILSRQTAKRRAENAKFLELARPVIRWFRMWWTIYRDKEHRYFKCPNCGQYLRVPRGKGKVTITCRSCGASFGKKS